MAQGKSKLKQDRITITISREIWYKLSKLKINRNFKGFNETIDFLLKNFRINLRR